LTALSSTPTHRAKLAEELATEEKLRASKDELQQGLQAELDKVGPNVLCSALRGMAWLGMGKWGLIKMPHVPFEGHG